MNKIESPDELLQPWIQNLFELDLNLSNNSLLHWPYPYPLGRNNMTLQSHRALETPELLSSIFGLLDRQSNAKNAQVCKVWFNFALDELWGNVNELHRLLAILCPLKPSGKGLIFKRSPRTNDWKRFEKYASHVRQLEYTDYRQLSPSVFDELSRTRRRLEIFPNLQILNWRSPSKPYILFMHSGIEKLMLEMDENPALLGDEIVDRTPSLSDFQIRSSYHMEAVEKDLVDMLQQLSNLRKITLEPFYSTEQITEALSHLKLLDTIEFEIDGRYIAEDKKNTNLFYPKISEGSFPSLRKLSVTANFDSDLAIFWLLSGTSLTYFRLYSGLIEKPESVHRLACAISKNIQELKTLRLKSWRDYNIDREYPVADYDDIDCDGNGNIGLETLKPLFKLQYLTSLEFRHQYPLLITQQEIETIASSCPFIENLQLCIDPGFCMRSTLTLEALVPLAQYCTRLKSLGLFIDATRVPTVPPNTPPFTSLHTFSVGLSIIKDDMPAVYLSQLIPQECVIKCDFEAWENYEWDDALEGIVVERCRIWAVVKSLAPKLSSVLAQERLRTCALERELRDLKVRMKAQQEFLVAQGWLNES